MVSGLALRAQNSNKVWMDAVEFSGQKKTKTPFLEEQIVVYPQTSYTKPVLDSLIVESVNRLNRTQLFKTIDYNLKCDSLSSDSSYTLTFNLVERWYFWPYPIVELADPNINIFLNDPDFSRVRYGIAGKIDNINGAGDRLSFRIIAGFSQEVRVSYNRFPRKKWQLSYGLTYVQFPQLEVNNIAAVRQFERLSPRLIKERFGAGTVANKQIDNRNSVAVSFGINQSRARDSLLEFNERYYGREDLNSLLSSTITANFRNDSRNNIAFPFQGQLFDAQVVLPYYKNHGAFLLLNADYRTYKDVNFGIFAVQGQGQIAFRPNQGVPFEHIQSNRLRNVPRVFDLYVPHSDSYFQARSQFLFMLARNKVLPTSFIRFSQFNNPFFNIGLGPFVDQVFFYSATENGSVYNKWLQSTGLTLQLATYYDKVFRVDMGYNSLGDFGLFLHISKAI